MKNDPSPSGSPDNESREKTGRAWLIGLQQTASLVYLVAGAFLIYQYWTRLHRPSLLVIGILFVLYSFYRYFLVRRSARRR